MHSNRKFRQSGKGTWWNAELLAIAIALSLIHGVYAEENKHRIYGNFIQPWLCAAWSEEQWRAECEAMNSLGIEAFVLGYSASLCRWDTIMETYYPSRLPNTTMFVDVIEPLFRYSREYGLKVYVGSEIHHDWWNWNMSNQEDANRFLKAMELSSHVLKELFDIYYLRYPDVFAGFFCTFEIWNHEDWDQKELRELHVNNLSKGFNILIDSLDAVAPELPLLFSPFSTVDGFASLENTKAFYIDFMKRTRFRKQDGMLPMDNIGGGGQTLLTVSDWSKMYFEAIKFSESNLNYYANVENFTKTNVGYVSKHILLPSNLNDHISSAPLGRFIRQLEIAEKYSSKIFVFSFSHYYSPVNNIEGYYNALLRYFKTGDRDNEFPTRPSTLNTNRVEKSGAIKIEWSGVYDNNGIARVYLYKDGQLFACCFATHKDKGSEISEPTFMYIPDFQNDGSDFRLVFIDVWGNEIQTPAFKIPQTCGEIILNRSGNAPVINR